MHQRAECQALSSFSSRSHTVIYINANELVKRFDATELCILYYHDGKSDEKKNLSCVISN